MKRYIAVIAVFAAFALAAGTSSVFAGGPGFSGDYDTVPGRNANEAGDTAGADMWPASGQVETGAIQERKSSPSLIDTHFDPFHPELREVDRSTGG